MPTAKGEISWNAVHDAARFKRLSTQLKAAGNGKLRRKLNNAVRNEGRAALRAVQRAWMTVDVTSSAGGGTKSTGLRSRVAAATRIQILGSGIRVSVQASKVDPVYGRSLTYGLNGLGRWRYPVFPDPDKTRAEWTWRQNVGQEVFHTTLRRFEPRWRRGIQKAMDEIAAEITS